MTDLNLTWELARLLNYTSTVATAIRMNSPYSGNYNPKNQTHANDVMWLADSLHNFNMLGQAIQGGDPRNIAFACDMLLTAYKHYTEDPHGHVKGDPKGAFERNAELCRLNEGMAILADIRAKVQP